MAKLCAVAVVVASAAASARASADEDPLALEWNAPKECPSATVVRSRALERMPPDVAHMVARGRVDRARGRYRLALEIESHGDRVLEASTCDALASSAAVVLAMSAAPKERAPSEELPPPPPDAAEAPEPEPPSLASRGDVFNVRAQAIHDSGILPLPAFGAGFAFGSDPIPHLHLEVAASMFLDQDGHSVIDATRGARFSLVSFDARACWGLTKADELAACAGVDIVNVRASGFGTDGDRRYDASATTWGPDVGLGVRLPLGRTFALRLNASVLMPTARDVFEMGALGRVHRPEAVVFRTFAGPEVRF